MTCWFWITYILKMVLTSCSGLMKVSVVKGTRVVIFFNGLYGDRLAVEIRSDHGGGMNTVFSWFTAFRSELDAVLLIFLWCRDPLVTVTSWLMSLQWFELLSLSPLRTLLCMFSCLLLPFHPCSCILNKDHAAVCCGVLSFCPRSEP